MNGTTILITIISGVCLLLYGLQLVQNGVTRAYGAKLKSFIAQNTKSRLRAFVSGLGVTAAVQSSTATSLIISAFADKNLVSLSAALAVLLGADVGTTLIAQLLSLDLRFLMPLFIIVGVIGRKTFKSSVPMYVSKAIIGLGLMLMALHIIMQASEPMGKSEITGTILSSLDNDIVMAFIVSALLTWLSHSSLATILFVMTLASQNLLTMQVSLVFVIGAQVGGAIAPLILNMRSEHAGRYVTIGEFSMRFLSALIILPFMPYIIENIAWLPGDTSARQIVNFHTLFSLARALLFLPLTGVFASLITKLFYRKKEKETDPAKPVYLDDNIFETPSLALSCAARETLRLGDIVEDMLKKSINMFKDNDISDISSIRSTEEIIDKLYTSIKLYMTRVPLEGLSKREGRRAVDILTFATNLEHIGDILDRDVCDLALKKSKRNLTFSKDGFAEISEFHTQLCKNIRLAMNTFMTEDVKPARKLIKDKDLLRNMAEKSREKHFKRLRDGNPDTVQSSGIHIDLIRDYAQINSYLTGVAYGILAESGDLQSRIKKDGSSD